MTGQPVEPPTNNFIQLANASGDVRVFDSKGMLLATNFVYLPRIAIADLSNDEVREVLENKTAYLKLTTFGQIKNRTAQSGLWENQLQQIWRQGKSLQEKIQTRMAILDEMRAYNDDLALYAGSTDYANRVTPKAMAAAGEANNHATLAQGYAQNAATAYVFENYRVRNYNKRQEDAEVAKYATAQRDATVLANEASSANQQTASYEQKCERHAARLAGFGLSISADTFYFIPPLSMRAEIDAERVKSGQ